MAKDDIQKFIDKVKKLERGEKLDLSSDEDLSVGVMNLISIEEHLFFTFQKTGNEEFLKTLKEVREMRKDLLKKLVRDPEGEVWCISKHLLAASMRLLEVGTKMLGKGDEKGASEMFGKSYQLYSLFWGLNLGLVKASDVKQKDLKNIDLLSDSETPKAESVSIFAKLGEVVKKVVDCCKE